MLSTTWWAFVNALARNGSDIVSCVICLEPDSPLGVNGLVLAPRALYLPARRAANEPVTIKDPIVAIPTTTRCQR